MPTVRLTDISITNLKKDTPVTKIMKSLTTWAHLWPEFQKKTLKTKCAAVDRIYLTERLWNSYCSVNPNTLVNQFSMPLHFKTDSWSGKILTRRQKTIARNGGFQPVGSTCCSSEIWNYTKSSTSYLQGSLNSWQSSVPKLRARQPSFQKQCCSAFIDIRFWRVTITTSWSLERPTLWVK